MHFEGSLDSKSVDYNVSESMTLKHNEMVSKYTI